MDPATDGKSLEKRLKVTALAWACTLTPPTGFQRDEPPSDNGSFCIFLHDLVTFVPLLHAKRFVNIISSFPRWESRR